MESIFRIVEKAKQVGSIAELGLVFGPEEGESFLREVVLLSMDFL
jgi:hypothetical protein